MPLDPTTVIAELQQAKVRLEELRASRDPLFAREQLNHINRGLCWLEYFLEEEIYKAKRHV